MIASPQKEERLTAQVSDRDRRFAEQYVLAASQLRNLTAEGIRNLETFLVELSREIRSILAAIPVDVDDAGFVASFVPGIRDDIRTAINTFARQAGDAAVADLTAAADLGNGVFPNAMVRAGLQLPFRPVLTPELLIITSNATRALFTEMGDTLMTKIMREIRLSAAGVQTSSQAIQNIIRRLQVSTETARGLRRRTGFASQALSIVRTELGRIFTIAQQATSEQLAESIPGLRKSWVTTLKIRRGHREAAERYKVGGVIGPILISESFRVTDYSRTGRTGFVTIRSGSGSRVAKVPEYSRGGVAITENMLHPLDPAASPGNVINCTCLTVELIPGLEEAHQLADELLSDFE